MTALPTHATSDLTKAQPVANWRAALLLPWFAALVPLVWMSVVAIVLAPTPGVADFFFAKQDCPVLVLTGAMLLILRFAPVRLIAMADLHIPLKPPLALALLAAAAAIVAVGGWFVVCRAYPLSMDEFMATFDATILRRGQAIAYLPEQWRPYIFPLQPQFILYAAAGTGWSSIYLPVNALLRAGFGVVGAPWAVGAVCAVASVTAVYGVARRLWPERPDAAVIAALLLASSSQFLVTAMTPYAMSAHLAFNLVWLWLFLRPGWASQAGAIVVAALACGLHQVIFHPLFAAPFVLALWLDRRWGRAALHTVAYAVIGLGWIFYWKLILPPGGGGLKGGMGLGFDLLLARLEYMAAAFNLSSIGLMAKNLIRFIAWQNPLLPILAFAGLGAAFRAKGIFRPLIAGVVLTVVAIWFLMPYQGHGWGYRYLHGFLGSFVLVAALGWIRLTDSLAGIDRRAAQGILVVTTVFSIAVVLPLHAVQANAMIKPYAAAAHAIDRTPAEVVVVDPSGLFYATDLVRNDPFLRNAPKRMDLGVMTDTQVRGLCAEHRTALFERREGLALGLSPSADKPTAHLQAMRNLLDSLHCGERTTPLP